MRKMYLWFRRNAFRIIGVLAVLYLLVAFGRYTAGARITLWGENPGVARSRPAEPLVLPQPTDLVVPPAPLQPPPTHAADGEPAPIEREPEASRLSDEEAEWRLVQELRRQQ